MMTGVLETEGEFQFLAFSYLSFICILALWKCICGITSCRCMFVWQGLSTVNAEQAGLSLASDPYCSPELFTPSSGHSRLLARMLANLATVLNQVTLRIEIRLHGDIYM